MPDQFLNSYFSGLFFTEVHIARALVTTTCFSFTMEKNEEEFLVSAMDLVKMVQSSYHTAAKSMKDDEVYLKKMYEDFSSSSDSKAKEMMRDLEAMYQALQLAAQLDNPSKASNILETLRTCFNNTNGFLRE